MANIEQQANHVPGYSFSRPVLHDAGISSVAGTDQLEGQWEDVPPAVGHGSVQSPVQNLYHPNMANHGMADYQEPSGDPAGSYTYQNVGLVRGISDHVQAIFPENQGNKSFGYVPQGIIPGSIQATFPGPPSGHCGPALGQPGAENLRRLASRYVNHPDSQIDMVRMEPGSIGRYKVVIELEMADFV